MIPDSVKRSRACGVTWTHQWPACDVDGRFLIEAAPATSLYHVVGAITELWTFYGAHAVRATQSDAGRRLLVKKTAQPIFACHLPNPEARAKKPAPYQTNRCLLTPWRILRIDFGDHGSSPFNEDLIWDDFERS